MDSSFVTSLKHPLAGADSFFSLLPFVMHFSLPQIKTLKL